MTQFVDGPLGEPNSFVALMRSFAEGIEDYDALESRIKMAMTFGEFCYLKEKRRPGARTSYRGVQQNQDI